MKPRVLSLFAGIGGFDLGLERAGMQVVAQCEIDPFCQKVLRKHWPDVWMHDDVRTLTGEMVRQAVGEVDVICGGYPCQPFSVAGSRKGVNDPRHLWPEFWRLLCDLRPRVAVLENVRGHLSSGFGRVVADLAESGFDADWTLLSARQFGAWHKRERLFVVAHLDGQRELQPQGSISNERGWAGYSTGEEGDVADTTSAGLSVRRQTGFNEGREESQAGLVTGNQRFGSSGGNSWGTEPNVVRVVHGLPGRVDRVAALGNAIVPQCAEWVGRQVMKAVFPCA